MTKIEDIAVLPSEKVLAEAKYRKEHREELLTEKRRKLEEHRKERLAREKDLARWIPVGESLPEMDEEVIVLTDEHDTAPIYKIGFGHIVDKTRCVDYNGWNTPGVRYWMPCPEIPKED